MNPSALFDMNSQEPCSRSFKPALQNTFKEYSRNIDELEEVQESDQVNYDLDPILETNELYNLNFKVNAPSFGETVLHQSGLGFHQTFKDQ